jgi:parallel beta-helix repeat protein
MFDSGNRLYVGGNGPNNYTKIQDAIDNSSDGDTVFVFNGTYNEYIILHKSITLIGENKENTIITEDGRIVDIWVDGVQISGFTITGCIHNWFEAISIISNFNNIYDNIIKDNEGTGIKIGAGAYGSKGNIVSDNLLINNSKDGIRIAGLVGHDSGDNIIKKNIISNNRNGIYVLGPNCDDTLIGWNIIKDNSENGIGLVYCRNIQIKGNTIKNNNNYPFNNIHLYSSNNNLITGNILTNNTGTYCMQLEYSSNNYIVGNVISNNTHGMRLFSLSNDNIVRGNIICKNKMYGIQLSSGDNNFINNNMYNNYYAMYIYSENNIIKGNTIESNTHTGLYLTWSNWNLICENTISNNPYGVEIWSSHSNDIYHNNFISNSISALVDTWNNGDSCDNIWYADKKGNYWSDYTGLDLDGDFIGDTLYKIPNKGENQDDYPLMILYPFDEDPPIVEIVKPVKALYFRDFIIRPFLFRIPLIIGDITVEVNAIDDDSGIKKVEFFIDDVLKQSINGNDQDRYTYTLTMDRLRFIHLRRIKVNAYDNAGNIASDMILIRKFR